MVKIQVNSQGKAFYTNSGKVLIASSASDSITATNASSFPVLEGSKVWVEPTTVNNVTTYTIKDFNKTLQKNMDIVGGVKTFTDGAYGAFSHNDYLTVDAPASASRFECVVAFRAGPNDISTFQNILCFDPFLELYIDSAQLCVWSSSANDSVTCGSVYYNSKYYAKVIIENGVMTLSYSTDGTTFTGTVSISSTATSITSKKIGAGLYSGRYFQGSVFPSETYIKFDNTLFEGFYFSNALTGIAEENIAVNSTGAVSTILGD